MEKATEVQDELTVTRDRPRPSIWLGLAWLIVTACLGLGAWMLLELNSSDVYIVLVPGINSMTLGVSLSLLAIVPLIAGIHGLVRWIVAGIRHRWVSGLVKTAGWVSGIGIGLVFSYLAFVMFLLTPGPSYVLESPNDGRSVLVVNRTILHAGGFPVYEPRNWPIYVEVGSVGTNNAYDPFRSGKYRETWTAEGLELEFRMGSGPDAYDREVVQLRNVSK